MAYGSIVLVEVIGWECRGLGYLTNERKKETNIHRYSYWVRNSLICRNWVERGDCGDGLALFSARVRF